MWSRWQNTVADELAANRLTNWEYVSGSHSSQLLIVLSVLLVLSRSYIILFNKELLKGKKALQASLAQALTGQ